MQVKTRENENGGLDVVFLGCDFDQTVALRNAFSDISKNREYAQVYGKSLMPAIRESQGLSDIHSTFKTTVRDVTPSTDEEDHGIEDSVEDSVEDAFADWN